MLPFVVQRSAVFRLAFVGCADLILLFGVAVFPWATSSAVASPVGDNLRSNREPISFSSGSWELAPELRRELPASLLPLQGQLSPTTRTRLAGRHSWDRFVSDSRLAPICLTISPVTTDGIRVGHQVRAVFALRMSLAHLNNEQEEAEPLGLGLARGCGSYRLLTTTELTEVGLKSSGRQDERFVLVELTLLNRIRVCGTVHIVRQSTADSIKLIWAFDHRFDSQPDLRTTASRIDSTELGERVIGPAEPYDGGFGVVIARELPQPGDTPADPPLVIVESRLAFAEPEDWFGGSNLLRAKIPLITQEGVRTLRRQISAE
jgi:hypothetical protein